MPEKRAKKSSIMCAFKSAKYAATCLQPLDMTSVPYYAIQLMCMTLRCSLEIYSLEMLLPIELTRISGPVIRIN